MEIRVLGPVELVDGEHPLSLPTMPRRLLAMLVLRAGEACSADRLIEALWAEAPPASAAKLLQVYVSQLRKALPEPGCIHTGRSGYVLDLADGVLDAARFERLLKEANEMKREANPALAASLLSTPGRSWRSS
jgi:DNA-binding SARP family transcriptional activator